MREGARGSQKRSVSSVRLVFRGSGGVRLPSQSLEAPSRSAEAWDGGRTEGLEGGVGLHKSGMKLLLCLGGRLAGQQAVS